jgi:VWFA-related protein
VPVKENKTNQRLSTLLSGCAAILLAASFVSAQQPTPTPAPTERERVAAPIAEDDGEVIRVDSKLVVVPASVLDANGQPVMNLTAKDFRVEEEGRAQEVAEISNAEQIPLEIALLIDVSSSVNQLFEYEKAAAARFLKDVMKPEDRVSIFLVGERPVMVQPRESADRAIETLRTVTPTKKYTAFFDSVTSAVDYLKRNAPQRSRRVILTLSDGEDTYSTNTLASYERAYKEMDKKINTLTQTQRVEILNRYRLEAQDKNYSRILRDLQSADVVFYSINPSANLLKLNKISLRGQEGMQKFAEETGGTAFLPQIYGGAQGRPLEIADNNRKNEEGLDRIFRQIAAELRAQYLLQYYSEANFPSGKYVRLNTALNNKPGLRIKARRGYFAGNQ